MVCVDGVDGVGKTVLCNFLGKELGIFRYSPSFPVLGERAPRAFKQWSDVIVSDLYAKYGFPIIMDRSFLSVCVYEDFPYKNELIRKWVKNVSTFGNIMHIVLYGEDNDIDIFQKRKNDKFIEKEILLNQNQLFLEYADLFQSYGLKVERIHSDGKDLGRRVLDVIQANL